MENPLIPPGTVVVGLDGSPGSDRALDWAVDQAVRERRPLTLAHGADPVVDDGPRVLSAASRYVAELAPGLVVHRAMWPSDPRVALVRLAASAHLLVVGSRGRGPARSLLLGSVGVAVVRQSPCPVAVVRRAHPGSVRNGVVVGADGGPCSRAAVEHAYQQASLRGLPLRILYSAWPMSPGTSDDDVRMPVAEALSGLAEKYVEVRARLDVVPGRPDEELVAASSRMDLVVVGAHHSGRPSTIVNGSVALGVVERATCPVLVVP